MYKELLVQSGSQVGWHACVMLMGLAIGWILAQWLLGLNADEGGEAGDTHGYRAIVRATRRLKRGIGRRTGSIALVYIEVQGLDELSEFSSFEQVEGVLNSLAEQMREALSDHDPEHWICAANPIRVGESGLALFAPGEVESKELIRRCRVGLQFLRALPRQATGGLPLLLSARAGIALYSDSRSPRHMLWHAMIAARNCAVAQATDEVAIFDPAVIEHGRMRMTLLHDLYKAVRLKQLEIHYQPKVDARTGQVHAAEGLLRWRHPERGMVSPDVFVPLAEQSGLIHEIGRWVIEDACTQMELWRRGGLRIQVAVNISAVQLRDEKFVSQTLDAVRRHKVSPSRLTLEITESVVMDHLGPIRRSIRRLVENGIQLSIDDFGTGYSNLNQLLHLPVKELKLDRSFVHAMVEDEGARAIVEMMLQFARRRRLAAVAEGVETELQRKLLCDMGCDFCQGFLFAKPMSAKEFLRWALNDKLDNNSSFHESVFADTNTPTEPSPLESKAIR